MGFLDHSTNNIIVDAVLTDIGREKLAQGNKVSEFIVFYGFADDEIDYTLVKKYGTIVGKEKIEKNTPIFEASTNGENGVRSLLSTTDDPKSAQPILAVSTTSSTITSQSGSTLNITVSDLAAQLEQSMKYSISFDSRFIVLTGNFQATAMKAPYRVKVELETNGTDDVSIPFTLSPTGGEMIRELGLEKTITTIHVESSFSGKQQVSIVADYSK